MKRLYVDIKEDCNGNLTGPVKFPADSTFVFEALAEVIRRFSESCEVTPTEIAGDLLNFLRSDCEN